MSGKQYVGSTTKRTSSLDGIITALAKEKEKDCMQKYLHDHFLSEGHNGLINDVEIIFIDKTDPLDPSRIEEFWKTSTLYGLNVEE